MTDLGMTLLAVVTLLMFVAAVACGAALFVEWRRRRP